MNCAAWAGENTVMRKGSNDAMYRTAWDRGHWRYAWLNQWRNTLRPTLLKGF